MTIVLIIATAILSYMAFNKRELFDKYKFNAYLIYHKKDYGRMLSHGFIHADWPHLIINMLVLFFFGPSIEHVFIQLAGHNPLLGRLLFVVFYLSAIIIASLTSLFKHKNDSFYNSVGASGAVSAMVFASILIDPMRDLCLYGILCLPGIIWGPVYLIYTYYSARKATDHINHDAHFVGAVYGLTFPLFIEPQLLSNFFEQLFLSLT